MTELYICGEPVNAPSATRAFIVDLETFIILNIYKIVNAPNQAVVNIKPCPTKTAGSFIKVTLWDIQVRVGEMFPSWTELCKWPVLTKGKYTIAGLCSVARELIKSCPREAEARKLLGFREACLMACSESSIWTKFCEVDMVSTVKNMEQNATCDYLPYDLMRYEYHLEQPVRIHNVYKIAREKNEVPIERLNLHHTFAEGPFMTLSDVVLYCAFNVFFRLFGNEQVHEALPLTLAWYAKMTGSSDILPYELTTKPRAKLATLRLPCGRPPKQSLYTADRTRYKPERRMYTKQKDITNALRVVTSQSLQIENSITPFGATTSFDWAKIPLEADPDGGSIPKSRSLRKREQLENLARAVMELTGGKPARIVDFCSGSGHLGILLAVLLPKASIVLVENKERSLERAAWTVRTLGLDNVTMLQSNLDYFTGRFDVGMSLHACGVATDLVMQTCVRNRADFVCCPCCYGGIRNCYHLSYPRSKEFQSLGVLYDDYLNLAHAADQTHDVNNEKTVQGFVCMDVVDTDRKLYAESCGYNVHLGKLLPVSCTNKNNLLVGICQKG